MTDEINGSYLRQGDPSDRARVRAFRLKDAVSNKGGNMKYHITCDKCGADYEVEMGFAPGFCVKCGFDLPTVEEVKSKARLCAEGWMKELDELRPGVLAARDEWLRRMAEYEDKLQLLRIYKNRGIITQEELDPYTMKGENQKTLAAAIRAYRKEKTEVV